MPQKPEESPRTGPCGRSSIRSKERSLTFEIGIFGSYVRNEQDTESDLEILVELDEPLGWNVVDPKEDLEEMPGLPSGIARRPRLMQVVDAEAVYV